VRKKILALLTAAAAAGLVLVPAVASASAAHPQGRAVAEAACGGTGYLAVNDDGLYAYYSQSVEAYVGVQNTYTRFCVINEDSNFYEYERYGSTNCWTYSGGRGGDGEILLEACNPGQYSQLWGAYGTGAVYNAYVSQGFTPTGPCLNETTVNGYLSPRPCNLSNPGDLWSIELA
jgi:hypothetical protein